MDQNNQNNQTNSPTVNASVPQSGPVPAPASTSQSQQNTVPNEQVSPLPQVPTSNNVKGPMFKTLLEKFKNAPKTVKILVTVVVAFVVLVVLLLLAALVTGGGKSKSVVKPIATPTAPPGSPLPQVEITNPSRYATDSGVLKIESDVDGLSKEMDSVDLRQSTLRVPSLDFNVKFQ